MAAVTGKTRRKNSMPAGLENCEVMKYYYACVKLLLGFGVAHSQPFSRDKGTAITVQTGVYGPSRKCHPPRGSLERAHMQRAHTSGSLSPKVILELRGKYHHFISLLSHINTWKLEVGVGP